MSNPVPGPFGQTSAPAVRLDRPPLLRVLCQVAWPEQTLLSATFNQIADEIGLALASAYPTLEAMPTVSLEVDALTGQVRPPAAPVSRQWSSLDEHWMVYFTPRFITLENRAHYTNRDDMIGRFEELVAVVAEHAQLPAFQRVGWRYVNRISDPAVYADLSELVQDSVRGAQVIPIPIGTEMNHSLTDSLFVSKHGSLAAKWGYLPPNASHDPTIDPVPLPSWILDLDAFEDSRLPYSVASVMDKVRDLSSTAYSFFRWAVKPEFMNRFGGHE